MTAIKSGDKETGKRLLTEILKADSSNENAWLWLTQVVTSDTERLRCLQNVLRINPNNESAKRGLVMLQQKQAKAPESAESLNPQVQIKEEIKPEATKQCLHCAETIKVEVKFCPFCGGKQEIDQELNEPSKLATESTQPDKAKPLPKPVEEFDLEEINAYVIKALDEFGMKKWGVGRQGCLFIKGKKYGVYREYDGLPTYDYSILWIVVSNKREVNGIDKELFKQPGYELRFYKQDRDFGIYYGGYREWFDDGENIHGLDLKKFITSDGVSESALRKLLKKILDNDYEPMAIMSHHIEPNWTQRVI